MKLPPLGIRSRLLLLGILPAAVILAAVLAANFLRMRSLLLSFGEEILRDRVKAIAAGIDRDTREAVTVARGLAMAMENGLLGRRADAIRLARDVLDSYPQFTGVSLGLEPNADGLDGRPSPDVPAEALGEGGRFIPYWSRDAANPATLRLNRLVMLDSLYYAGTKERFLDPGQADKALVTEPYDYDGRLMVEQMVPIVIDGHFAGVAGVDRAIDQVAHDLAAIQRQQRDAGWHVEVFLI
ncbi:MAG: cache domain-containing protein, partial [Planctomycetaceae bacterium]